MPKLAVLKSLQKIPDPDSEAADFQNLRSSSLPTCTSLIKSSRTPGQYS